MGESGAGCMAEVGSGVAPGGVSEKRSAYHVVLADGSHKMIEASSLTAQDVLQEYPGHVLALSAFRPLRIPLETVLFRWNTYYLHPDTGGRTQTVELQHERKSLRALHRRNALALHFPQSFTQGGRPPTHNRRSASMDSVPCEALNGRTSGGNAPLESPNNDKGIRILPTTTVGGTDSVSELTKEIHALSSESPGEERERANMRRRGHSDAESGNRFLRVAKVGSGPQCFPGCNRSKSVQATSASLHPSDLPLSDSPSQEVEIAMLSPPNVNLPPLKTRSSAARKSTGLFSSTTSTESASQDKNPSTSSQVDNALSFSSPNQSVAPKETVHKAGTRVKPSKRSSLEFLIGNKRDKLLVVKHKKNPVPSRFLQSKARQSTKYTNDDWNSAPVPVSCIDFRHLNV